MRIAAVQLSCTPGDIRGNMQTLAAYARQGADQGCRLLLFPEISDIGYDLSHIARRGRTAWPEVRDTLLRLAQATGVILVCGVCIADTTGLANGLVAFGTDGRILATYRKSHLLQAPGADESRVFTAGNELVCLDVDGIRFGLSICYDLRFPELFRAQMQAGCSVLLLSSAWPKARRDIWRTLTAARAVENQCWLLGANQCGKQGAFPFGGHSVFVGPAGETTALGEEEGLLTGDIIMEQQNAIRSAIPALTHIRTELYSEKIGKGTESL